MKKLKNLLFIPLAVLVGFMGVWLSNLNNVEAANNSVCQATWLRDNVVQKVEVNAKGNISTLTNNSGYNLDYRFIPDGNESAATTGRLNNGASIDVRVENGGAVYFYLVDSISDPCLADAGAEAGLVQIYAGGEIDNTLYNDSVCVNYRNRWGNNEMMQKAVPYCYSQTTSANYSREEVQGWIDTAEELYESIQSSSGGTDITIDPSYQEVKDVKNTDKLVCDAFSTNNYETMHKYYHVETDDDGDGCKVTCKEEIEVNFSDPVATQAGMCFQYLIEIKSKVVCDGNYTAPVPTRKEPCILTPLCVSGTYAGSVGGPNEEFDDCIQSCDGGEYTQECIDSCYNKVYKSNNKTTKTSTKEKLTREDVIAMSALYNPGDSFYEATKLANSCPGTGDAQALYNYMQRNPGGYYSGGSWIPTVSGICGLAPYYFSSLAQTQTTIALSSGSISYSGIYGGYHNYGDGFLRENYGNTYCDDYCYWLGSCPSDAPLTETLAQEQYEKEVEEYLAKKRACEQKAATCTNETTNYEIVVDNVDSDGDTDDDEETFSSSQKLNNDEVTGDFPSMVILTDGKCEDGEDDPWHYHNIITFPGAWINNKTGQIVHTMDPGREDFYTYVGNQYCTKLDSVPINTAWYDWKVNQNGNSSALTDSEKKQIEDNLEMNINGHIDNYGYFGWNFDISCFYAIGEPETECSPDDPNYPTCDDQPDGGSTGDTPESPVDDYIFRPVSLDNLFPNSGVTNSSSNDNNITASSLINTVESMRGNSPTLVADDTREIGFNWTCGATNLENPDYIIQPVSVMNEIQALGDSIYEGTEYLDYHITLTPEVMERVRKYNRDNDNNYSLPTSNEDNLSAGNDKTAGITVYRSYLLHRVIDDAIDKFGVIGCNNEDNGTCPNVIDTSTSCYNEYMAQSSVLKGAK